MPFSIIDPDAAEPVPEFYVPAAAPAPPGTVLAALAAGQSPAGFASVPSLLAYTDRLGAAFAQVGPLQGAVAAQLQAARDLVYGAAANGNVSLGDSRAIDALGPPTGRALTQSGGNALFTFYLGPLVAALGSYVKAAGQAAGLPLAACQSLAALLRAANGCPDPGSGVGSSYAWLVSPEYAQLVASLTLSASLMPPDTVFAPDGLVLATYDRAADAGLGGPSLMTAAPTAGQPTPLPYAPTRLLAVQAAPAPDGTLPLDVSVSTGQGTAVTLSAQADTGQITAPGGGALAAWADSVLQVTAVARSASGGTATAGQVRLVTQRQRALPA